MGWAVHPLDSRRPPSSKAFGSARPRRNESRLLLLIPSVTDQRAYTLDLSPQEAVQVLVDSEAVAEPVSYTHLTLPTTPYV